VFVPPLHPDFAALADFDMGFGFGTDGFDLAGLRAAIDDAIPAPPPIAEVRAEQVVLGGGDGLLVETCAPIAPGPHPALVWLHGGGYVMGAPVMDAARMQLWSATLGCFVASVDYRLAPDHPFPAAHDDAMQALTWLIDSADELGVATDRIVVGGASAGGGLAAGVALAARDRGLSLAGQLLFYPMVDDRRQTASSTWDAPVWSQSSNEYGWRSYLGGATEEISPYAAPARSTDLAGLPPSMVIIGGADRFLDEDLDYASRLAHAGVPTDVRVYAGAPHGFDLIVPDAPISVAAVAVAVDWLRARFTA
jgi:acetyl esterase/lipase